MIRGIYFMYPSAASWKSIISKTMRYLGFTPCLTDIDTWICAATKLEFLQYWVCVIIQSDYLLVLSHQADLVMKDFDKAYTLKSDPKTGSK